MIEFAGFEQVFNFHFLNDELIRPKKTSKLFARNSSLFGFTVEDFHTNIFSNFFDTFWSEYCFREPRETPHQKFH
jgi:hypothetical protein